MAMSDADRRAMMAAVWDAIGDDYGSGPPMLVELAERLVDKARLRPGERVIDLGTGNGHGLLPAASAIVGGTIEGQIVGIDISNTMLDLARARVAASGLHNVELRNMDVSNLDFPDATFDVALASTVFQFVGYAPAVLAEWRRVLAPGGRLLMSVPAAGRVMGPLEDLMADYFTRLAPAIQEGWRRSGSTPGRQQVPDLVALCEEAGFESAEIDDQEWNFSFPDVDAWWAFQWTHGSRAFLMALPPDAVADMRADAAERLAPTMLPTGEVPVTTTSRFCRAAVAME
jgi:SAM-dependent methyltransferase